MTVALPVPSSPSAPPAAGGLDRAAAEALTGRIRAALAHTQDLLRAAWRGRIWVPLGLGSFEEYVAVCLGDLRLRMPTDERRAEVARWRAEGASVRAIAKAVGASVGTVSADLPDAGPARVVGLDGHSRPARAPRATTARCTPTTVRAETLLAAAGAAGLTSAELGRRLRLHHGSSSATMTRLRQQGRAVPTEERRGGYTVYLAPAPVDLA